MTGPIIDKETPTPQTSQEGLPETKGESEGKRPTITVIIPALNEEENIEATAGTVKEAIDGYFSDYEILIYNDSSTDRTGEIAESLSKKDSRIKVIHNPETMGLGFNYSDGVQRATGEYVVMSPGDNEIPLPALRRPFSQVGRAELIIPYTANQHVRPLSRRIVSWTFTALINILFGLNIVYFNGTCVLRTELVRSIPLTSYGFAYMASILVRLLRQGATYTEVPINIQYRSGGESKAFAIGNVVSVVTTILTLFSEVRITDRKRYSLEPKEVPVLGISEVPENISS